MPTQYSISDLARLSGIKAPTLRAWEQRYGLLKPRRSSSNVRQYSDEDLQCLMAILWLRNSGMRIRDIARLSRLELQQRAGQLQTGAAVPPEHMDTLTLAMLEMHEAKFDELLNLHTERLGFEQTLQQVIFPFLDKLQGLWAAGVVRPVQEHFATNLLRRKMLAAIDQLGSCTDADAPRLGLFLPTGEKLDLTLHLLHYLARSRGLAVLDLGMNVTTEDLHDASTITRIDYLFTMITTTFSETGELQNYLHALRQACPSTTILLSGYQAAVQGISPGQKLLLLNSLDEARQFLDKLATGEKQYLA